MLFIYRTGVKRVIDGNLELAGRSGEGKLFVKYSTSPLPTESTLVVLDTDYDSYAVIWNCNGFGPIHARKLFPIISFFKYKEIILYFLIVNRERVAYD